MSTAAEIRQRLSQPWQHGSHADFRGVCCDELLDLSGLALDGVDLSGAQLAGGIDASGARFDGLCWFREVTITGPARFDGTTFMNDARFEGARFAGASFRGAEFRGIGRFDGAQFAEGGDFAGITCYGNFSLQSVEGRGTLSFRGSEWLGGLWCDHASLPKTVDLAETQVHGRLWLRDARRGAAALRPEDFGMAFGYAYI
ncbi:pentapeptide repeat-containing protein [Marinovum sp.]|uniref:pentapeptide repeat-containing protein n=1 Tax=Marinovum sp. TaxID=2024839 RepID=UPI002B264C02|nr:pentapeptide repeat-containing protein [Marinovum sp.]